MATAWPNPVTPDDVAAVIGADPTEDRLIDATTAAWELVIAEVDWAEPESTPTPDYPEPMRTATVGLAIDLYRLPTTAFGYFVNDVGIASTGTDVMRRWRNILAPYKEAWGLA